MCLRRGKISIWGVRSADSVERFPASSNSSKGNKMYVNLGNFAKCGFFFFLAVKKYLLSLQFYRLAKIFKERDKAYISPENNIFCQTSVYKKQDFETIFICTYQY